MTSNKHKSKLRTFRTYVDIADNEFQERAVDVPEIVQEEQIQPFLLPGEIVIATANNVLKFAPMKTNKTGISGVLFVTNFKVSFLTTLPIDKKDADILNRSLQSEYIGVHDVCLSQVDQVFQITDGTTKKKRLIPNVPLPSRLLGLQLVLKNFRMVNFSFKFTRIGDDIRVTNAVLHHSFPTCVENLFLTNNSISAPHGIPEFNLAFDWERELERTRCPNWRVSKHNEVFNMSSTLSPVIVVAHSLLDSQLEEASHHFQGGRPPVWCWGSQSGAALLRMANISPNISDKQQENLMIGFICRCHPRKTQPVVIECDLNLPSLKEIQTSWLKLRELHTPDDPNQYWEQDRQYLSRFHHSRWLSHVSKCLEMAQYAANLLTVKNTTVIIQEGEGRDLSCIISSLVQIIIDPFARTLRGFHCMIQKEWVALGHPFTSRLGLTRNQPEEQCPLWLLFLDCVHQLCHQNEAAMEFSEQYLIALWDASHCSVNASFMFNCISAMQTTQAMLQRESGNSPFELSCIWNWWSEKNDSLSDPENRLYFMNVNHAQSLLQTLTKGPLSRIKDPCSSLHQTFHHLRLLLKAHLGCLPYDPLSPPLACSEMPHLCVNPLPLYLRPWINCLNRWVTEPTPSLAQPPDPEMMLQLYVLTPQWTNIFVTFDMVTSIVSRMLTVDNGV